MIGGHFSGSGVPELWENWGNLVDMSAGKASEQTINIILIQGSRRTWVTQEGRADDGLDWPGASSRILCRHRFLVGKYMPASFFPGWEIANLFLCGRHNPNI